MPFTDIATEQTTAITDLMLAVQAMGIRVYLGRAQTTRPFATTIWSWIFTLAAFASILGAVAHGFEMSAKLNAILWVPLYFALGMIVALFLVAGFAHRWSDGLARRCLPISVCVGVAFFVATQLWSDSFILFVAYEAVAMLIVLALYTSCFWQTFDRRGSGFLAMGVFVGLLSAMVDAQHTLRVTCIWTFDNHGVFHLIQMLSFLLLAIGLYRAYTPAGLSSSSTESTSVTHREGLGDRVAQCSKKLLRQDEPSTDYSKVVVS
jgi:hypothetical protein